MKFLREIGPVIRKKLPDIYYFLTAIIKELKKIQKPYMIYITDSLGGSFKEYIIRSDMPARVADLKRNLDEESRETIDVIVSRLIHYPDESYADKISSRRDIAGGLLPPETPEIRALVKAELVSLEKTLCFPGKYIEESVFYYFHGLRLLPEAVNGYLRGCDFIDAGAYIGDSAIALRKYDYRKIYSIEISQKSIKRYKAYCSACGLPEGKYELVNAAITGSDYEDPAILADTGSAGISLIRRSGRYDEIRVEQVTIDSLVERYKIEPRFIKADVEGHEMEVLKGAVKTLTRYRPVLSFAIYHNPREFFELKPYIEVLLDNYIFLIRKLNSGIRNNLCHSEVILIGYPAELTGSNNHDREKLK